MQGLTLAMMQGAKIYQIANVRSCGLVTGSLWSTYILRVFIRKDHYKKEYQKRNNEIPCFRKNIPLCTAIETELVVFGIRFYI